jgi:inorganic pyrophosphatase
MKKAIEKLEPFDKKTGCLNVIIETPKGSRIKYAYDHQTGFMTISKALPEGMTYPFNFGFIPKTLADDGDPLDVLILNEESLISGCLLQVRPIAVIKAEQTEKKGMVRNDRIIGQALSKEAPLEFQTMELKRETISQIEFFFKAYNKMYGKKFRVIGTGGPKKAIGLIHQSIKQAKKANEHKVDN